VSVLADIVSGVKADLAERRAACPLADIASRAADAPAALQFLPRAADDFSIIAEVKRSSPSAGALADIADPAGLASSYAAGGAAAISVLTEQRRFNGCLDDLDAVRAAVDIPVLRKDFMVDEYQFHEARAHGADIVLLIVAALSPAQLQEFSELSASLGMAALVETHTAEEIEIAAGIEPALLGINTRNLKDLSVDLNRFAPLAELCPPDTVLVGESGVSEAGDVAAYAAQGADLALVGQALVTGGKPRENVAEFTEAGRKAKAERRAP